MADDKAAVGKMRRRRRAVLVEMDNKDEVSSLGGDPVESSAVKAAGTMRRRKLAALMEMQGSESLGTISHSTVEIQEDKMAAAMRAKVMDSCGSWVVEVEKLMEGTDHSVELECWKNKYIRKVPDFLKRITARDVYQPHMVSLGPIHHGQIHLLPMEVHKRRAVVNLVKRSKKPLWQFVAAIEQVAEEVLGAYDDIDGEWRDNKPRFVQMLLTDACFLIEIMQISMFFEDKDDYAVNDPVFGAEMFKKLWPMLRNDMVCFENQIPIIVLHKVQLTIDQGTSAVQSSKLLINLMVHNLLNFPISEKGSEEGRHVLDILHRSVCGQRPRSAGHGYKATVPACATELKDAGVQFQKGKPKSIHDLDFQNGILTMPLWELDNNAETIFLNLMAWEWVIPGTERDVASYISFVDKIIQSDKDVVLLRSKGIFNNTGISDIRTVEMIKSISAISWYPEPGSRLGHIQFKIDAYCKKRRNRWRAIFKKTYLSNPYVFVSLVVAVLYFLMNGLELVFSILGYNPHKD